MNERVPTRPRVLIIEDEAVIRTALRRLLERHGYQVSEAGSIDEAEDRGGFGDYGLIIADLRIEPLVADLVGDDVLRHENPIQRPPVEQHPGPGGDEGGVLHSAGAACSVGGIDDGEGVVGVAPVPEPVPLERGLGGTDVALELGRVLGLQEQDDLHVAEPHLLEGAPEEPGRIGVLLRSDVLVRIEGPAHLHEARVRGPREVVHARLLEDVGGRPVPVHPALPSPPGGPHHEALGKRDLHVVVAEVRVELRAGVELVAVPAVLPFEHAELRKPLADQVEIARVPGPGDDPRQLGLELELELDDLDQLVLAPEVMLPAPGQGALAAECRAGDPTTAVADLVNRLLQCTAVELTEDSGKSIGVVGSSGSGRNSRHPPSTFR